MEQKITTHLWFDKEARQAAEFYVSVFPQSNINSIMTLDDTPSGTVANVSFELLGRPFQAISAGPEYKINPSVSFFVTCGTRDEVDRIWARLSDGGFALMELGAYPFSAWYGWVQDKYGVSWQISLGDGTDVSPQLTPFMLFVGGVYGRAEEAIRFWTSVFPDSQVGGIERRGEGEEPDKPGTVKYGEFSLAGQQFGAMESAYEHPFAFNEAISFMVMCENQEEIDYYWDKLSAAPEAEQCGWLKDKFGVSWQIVPAALGELLFGDPAKAEKVTEAFMQMKKLDIATLRQVAKGQ